MILKSVLVSGLFDRNDDVNYVFNDDLNIFTGRNGSGKTTIMKLVWFIISGNIIHALKEVKFKSCVVETDSYICNVVRTGPAHCKIFLEKEGVSYTFEDDYPEDENNPFGDSAEDKVKDHLITEGSSIFFPTFRRIEGGFSLVSGSTGRSRPGSRSADIDDALTSLSKTLSNNEHIFVAAISTQDINGLLLRRYAGFSEEINAFQEKISRGVIDKIKAYQKTQNSQISADSLLAETREDIEKIERFRDRTMRPFDAVRGLAEKLFQHSGISFGRRINFGDAAAAVNSHVLSAGEKQMLSFICYNAFHRNSIIFIDEPELSLHVDWQRQLYPILESQKTSSQFIFATHSPFIYGKYPDKEVAIGADRGE